MRWNSFRVRLTLWNMAILALVLGGFGLAFCVSIQSWMMRSIDHELQERAQRSGRRGPGRRPPSWGPGRDDRFRGGRERRDSDDDRPGSGPARQGPPWTVRADQGQGTGSAGPRSAGGSSVAMTERPQGTEEPNDVSRPGPGPSPAPGPPGSRPEGPPFGRFQQGWPDDPEARRRASFQWPRVFDAEGKPWSPRPFPPPDPAWDPGPVPEALAGGRQYSTIIIEGDRVRLFTAPRYEDGRIVGAVQVARDLRDLDRLWRGQVGTLLALLPLSLLVAGIGGLFLTNRALRPVHDVTHAAAQIGVEDLSRRLKVIGRDELAELAATFNGMIARLEAAFEQQRRFTADASHELRTPLARIKVSTSMALAGEQPPEEYRTALRIADQAANVMDRLIQQLLLLARVDAGQLGIQKSCVDLRSILQEAVTAVSRKDAAPVTLDVPPEPIEIDGDADLLSRVFINLLENALRHTLAEGQIVLRARVEGDHVEARVIDTGEGIPPEHLPHLGERFYRVDAARARKSGGTGLGLAISRSILQAHGGHLAIESEVGRGTVVTVSLPRLEGCQ